MWSQKTADTGINTYNVVCVISQYRTKVERRQKSKGNKNLNQNSYIFINIWYISIKLITIDQGLFIVYNYVEKISKKLIFIESDDWKQGRFYFHHIIQFNSKYTNLWFNIYHIFIINITQVIFIAFISNCLKIEAF